MTFRLTLVIAAMLAATAFAPESRSQEPADRKILVEQVVELERSRSFGDGSVLVEKLFERLRPFAKPEQWVAFKADAARHLQAIVFRPDGPVVNALTTHLESFSIPELVELKAVLQAPAYRKYQELGTRISFLEASQTSFIQAVMESAPALEEIAKKHGIAIPAK